ncbi:MAG: hypothetical protein M0Z94_02020 [Dehalococcoidales bacterium]|nr:hypothetical protein [Dehalococcoidales bacterium]
MAIADKALADLAQETGKEFEASPTGRWIHFKGEGPTSGIYVVALPWTNGCVILGDEDNRQLPRRYLDPREAIEAAARHSGRPTSPGRAVLDRLAG